MPSLEQINELRRNATFTWTTLNGVLGCKFTGSNGSAVFFPAAGYRWDAKISEVGVYGVYWSSMPYDSTPCYSWVLNVSSDSAGQGAYHRIEGLPVRPVR